MAKVSVLILDERYHGWYLHCRSPYPRVSGRAVSSVDFITVLCFGVPYPLRDEVPC